MNRRPSTIFFCMFEACSPLLDFEENLIHFNHASALAINANHILL